MLKGLLLVLITAACAGMGRVFSNARRRRSELLGELLGAVRVLRIRVLNSAEPVSVLMEKSELPLFRNLAEGMQRCGSLEEAWAEMKRKATREMEPLMESDRALLDEFLNRLGKSGRKEQDELFSLTIARLEEAQTQAKNRFADASRTFTALGALVGAAICILIV